MTMQPLRQWLARQCRRFADWLDPYIVPDDAGVDALMPIVRPLVRAVETTVRSGSIRRVAVMKLMEQKTKASRLDINESIERAVRELRASHAA